MSSSGQKRNDEFALVGIVSLPSLPDDCDRQFGSEESQMKRFIEECRQLTRAGIGSLLLVNEKSFPFSNRLSVRDVAYVTRLLLELRRSVDDLRIGIDLVDDAEATFAVASAVDCDFVRVRCAGPYVGLTKEKRADHRRIRHLILSEMDNIETWLTLLPWGERLSPSWTLADLAASLNESISPDRIAVPFASADEVIERVGADRIVFDGGVGFDDLSVDGGTYVLGSALRNGSILDPLNAEMLSKIAEIQKIVS